ncbi:hypothetical protein Taro_050951 [Colocasia esculenta]|uniref:S-acyltransferase n=1 Tax=Colocasia esculenta TaxID=4460 RepID=A0A843XEQ5_COLES|nr:hypothetical protein [Colocasia esculenta]
MAGGKGGRLLSLPVLAVVALMAFVHYATVYVFVEDWLGLGSSAGAFNAVAFSFLALLCLASFCAAVLVDPGYVPASFALDMEDARGNGINLKYCDKCSSYKPPRSHHCRICRRCVMKMDHHCLWINNCVGYANYKPFTIFVLYASVSSIYSMVAYGGLVTILSIVLSTLLGWHIYLLSHNMTTIEYREGVRAMWLAQKSGQRYHHLFDLGMLKNLTAVNFAVFSFRSYSSMHLHVYANAFTSYFVHHHTDLSSFLSLSNQILGPNVLKWLCPLALGHLKDGTQFPNYRE